MYIIFINKLGYLPASRRLTRDEWLFLMLPLKCYIKRIIKLLRILIAEI